MEITITTDAKGGRAFLTTYSPHSHYGQPILRIEAEDVSGDYGPGDIIHEQNGKILLGAHVVGGWLSEDSRTCAEKSAGKSFLGTSGPELLSIKTLTDWIRLRQAHTV